MRGAWTGLHYIRHATNGEVDHRAKKIADEDDDGPHPFPSSAHRAASCEVDECEQLKDDL